MLVETYLRKGQRELQRLMLEPGIQAAGAALVHTGGGFLLSAASLMASAQPLAMGLICSAAGGRSVLISLGAMAGYLVFWGGGGRQGLVWAASGGLLAMLLGNREENRDQPLMIPAIAAFLVAVTGVVFRMVLGERTSFLVYCTRVGTALFSAALFTKARQRTDAVTDWLVLGAAALALAQVAPTPYLNLGFLGGGVVAAAASFPAAALFGLGLDLARVSPIPMTAVLCMAYFIRLIPFDRKWQRYLGPGIAYCIVMAVCGSTNLVPLPALAAGGALAQFLPDRVRIPCRRGETGAAQVRLELGSEVMRSVRRMVLDLEPPPIDLEPLVDKVRQRACAGCSARNSCTLKLTPEALERTPACRKLGRLEPELTGAKEQLRLLRANRKRQEEYRTALAEQYRFMGEYLAVLADGLPRRERETELLFRAEVSARSRGKERVNGDRCMVFPGRGGSCYVLLCDGMGTGIGAAGESQTAGSLLKKLLRAGFPPEHSLGTLNSLLALGGRAGAVSLDLAQVHLDTGQVSVYKWGGAPSWLLSRRGTKKIGTAAPPPGISVKMPGRSVEKLSLGRGEALILLSDGVDGEEALSRLSLAPDAPPGELAAKLLELGCGNGEDDATAVVIRLRPTGLATS